jgi:hypothetical protein
MALVGIKNFTIPPLYLIIRSICFVITMCAIYFLISILFLSPYGVMENLGNESYVEWTYESLELGVECAEIRCHKYEVCTSILGWDLIFTR